MNILNIFLMISFVSSYYLLYKLYYQKLENDKIKDLTNNIQITSKTIFVFDIDGVILTPDIKKICKIILTSSKIQMLYILLFPKLLYKIFKLRNDITTEQALRIILNTDPKLEPCVEIAYKISYAKKEIPEVSNFIRDLAKKYPLFILSNESIDGMKILTKEHPIFELFTGMFLTSYNDNYIKKPDHKFYLNFLAWIENPRFNQNNEKIDPKNLIFIDDRIINVIIANRMGIPSIMFTNINNLKQILFK